MIKNSKNSNSRKNIKNTLDKNFAKTLNAICLIFITSIATIIVFHDDKIAYLVAKYSLVTLGIIAEVYEIYNVPIRNPVKKAFKHMKNLKRIFREVVALAKKTFKV